MTGPRWSISEVEGATELRDAILEALVCNYMAGIGIIDDLAGRQELQEDRQAAERALWQAFYRLRD